MLLPFHKTVKGTFVVAAVVIATIFTSLAFPGFQRVLWYRQAILTIIEPPQRAITALENFAGDTWHHYIAITDAAKENDLLKVQIAELNQKLIRAAEIERENKNLREILDMTQSLPDKGIGAFVIASDVNAEFKTITIDKGYNDGIRKNMAVIGPGGLVGKIGQVSSSEARVLLISDPNSSVDVFVQRSGARAILTGTSRSTTLRPFFSLTRLEYLKRGSDINDGDVVITSGLDSLFPKNIPVGTIFNVEKPASGIFKNAEVVPFVDLTEVREVMVLK